MSVYRFVCPDPELSKNERINIIFEQIKAWVYSDEFCQLLELFNGKAIAGTCPYCSKVFIIWNNNSADNDTRANKEKLIECPHCGHTLMAKEQTLSVKGFGKNFISDIETIHEFVKIWDFRAGKERSSVKDNDFITNNKDSIMRIVGKLGLKDIETPSFEPNYILPLGGMRASNKVRPAMARKVIDDNKWSNKKVIALSGTRPIKEEEYIYMDYAENAITEYDAINRGVEIAFQVNDYREEMHNEENINSNYAIRIYSDRYKDCEIYSLAAPSSEPLKRRANSLDTFNFFLENFKVRRGEKILLVTSSIYVPFQLLKFFSLAIDLGLQVDAVGSDSIDNLSLSLCSNYLQEVKGTVDAIYSLTNKYREHLL